MDISLETLNKKSNNGAINSLVEEYFKAIKVKILTAHQMGHSETIFDLPDNFSIANMEPADCQLVVYSKLIEKIEEYGHRVVLRMEPGIGSSLEISWPNHLDPVEKARMRRVIVSHLKKTTDRS